MPALTVCPDCRDRRSRGGVSKVKTLASQQPDKADKLLSGVGDQIDQRTGGTFAGRTNQLQDMAKKALGI